MEHIYDNCPHCAEEWNGYECDTCGFADDWIDSEIVVNCPTCQDKMPYWADTCITCWHKNNKGSLTK